MKAYFSDILPKISRFSRQLDNQAILQKHQWVAISDLDSTKLVYIFRSKGELLVSKSGVVEKAKWEYLGKNSILIESNSQTLLYKHGFFDDDILLLKIDGKEDYSLFVNETRFDQNLRTYNDIILFLIDKYKLSNSDKEEVEIIEKVKFSQIDFEVVSEMSSYILFFGSFTTYFIKCSDETEFQVYLGKKSNKYYYFSSKKNIVYCDDLQDAVNKAYKDDTRKSLLN